MYCRLFVTPPLSSILLFRIFSIFVMDTNQVNALFGQTLTHGIRVDSPIINQVQKRFSRRRQGVHSMAQTVRPVARHRNPRERGPNQDCFVRRSRVKSDSQRYTQAVCHHKFRTLVTLFGRGKSAFGFSDQGIPFFVLGKMPLEKVSCQSSWPERPLRPKKRVKFPARLGPLAIVGVGANRCWEIGARWVPLYQRVHCIRSTKISSNTSRAACPFRQNGVARATVAQLGSLGIGDFTSILDHRTDPFRWLKNIFDPPIYSTSPMRALKSSILNPSSWCGAK